MPTICRICKGNCGLLVTRNGRRVEISGNSKHPISKGFICFRAKNFGEVHSSPERLRRPLLRKGSGWVELSFEDALDVLASNLLESKKQYGPQSVVFYKGEPLKHQEIVQYMRHLAYGFGTPNFISCSSLCHESIAMGHGLTYGGIPGPDFESMKVALIWGGNPLVSNACMSGAFKKAVSNGTKLVVVDPSRTQTAELAHLHLPITPGTDGFLALAFLKYAAENGLTALDPPILNGHKALESLVRGLSYEELLESTGIGEARFFEASSLVFENLPGWIQTGLALELQPNGVQTIRAIASLQSILDPGNRPSPLSAGVTPLPGMDRYPVMADPIGRRETPIYTDRLKEGQGMYLSRAILADDPYPVRAMLIAGGNPLLTFPDSHLHARAFGKLDFLAVFDLFMTPTAQAAHLVLPAADFLENLELHDYGVTARPYLGLVQPVVSDEAGLPTWKLIFELARRLGLEELFPWTDNGEAVSYRLSESGVTLDELVSSPSATATYQPSKPAGNGWSTSDGSVHYHSKTLERAGHSGLPIPEALRLPLSTDERFPFWLSTGDRVSCFQHSQFREHPTYKAAMPEPFLDIHPEAAMRLGIRNGDTVALSTRNGEIEVRTNLAPDVRPDCLRLTHGWVDANANALTNSDTFDPISGFPWMRALPAKVEKKMLHLQARKCAEAARLSRNRRIRQLKDAPPSLCQ